MPGKGGLPHAKVQVGSVDTLDNNATLLFHHIQQRVEVADVPLLNVLNGEKGHFYESTHYTQSGPQSLSMTTRWCCSQQKCTLLTKQGIKVTPFGVQTIFDASNENTIFKVAFLY